MDTSGDFAEILEGASVTDGWPSEDLLPLVYDELRSLASTRMSGEAAGQTLQATALVHEAWLRLAAGGGRTWADRAHFFRAAARAMRRILVDRARAKGRVKRGEGLRTIDIQGLEIIGATPDERILLVDEVLDRLENEDPESARLISLKFFGGLTEAEIAQTEGVAERTVRRRWAFAKVRLFRMIHEAMS